MKERPILFSTQMVQAIKAGRKTQTRRIIKGIPDGLDDRSLQIMISGHHPDYGSVLCPYGKVGDILWVRETFLKRRGGPTSEFGPYCLKADVPHAWDGGVKWKPCIHMPKVAAKRWLKVTAVSVERLHDISNEDAVAEGIELIGGKLDDSPVFKDYMSSTCDSDGYGYPFNSFRSLWESINGIDSWGMNPWVWRVEFEVLPVTGKPKEGWSFSN